MQSLTLCRSALEDWIAVVWIEDEPARKDLWLAAILPGVEQPRDRKGRPARIPSATTMMSDLGDQARLARVAYENLSKFVHPRGAGIRWQFGIDEGELLVRSGSYWGPADLRTCLYFLIQVAAGMLPAAERLQRRWLGEANPEWLDRSGRTVVRAHDYINQVDRDVIGAPDSRLR